MLAELNIWRIQAHPYVAQEPMTGSNNLRTMASGVVDTTEQVWYLVVVAAVIAVHSAFNIVRWRSTASKSATDCAFSSGATDNSFINSRRT